MSSSVYGGQRNTTTQTNSNVLGYIVVYKTSQTAVNSHTTLLAQLR